MLPEKRRGHRNREAVADFRRSLRRHRSALFKVCDVLLDFSYTRRPTWRPGRSCPRVNKMEIGQL